MPANDPFSHFYPELSDPGESATAITPNDNDSLITVTKSIYVGGAGDLRVIMEKDTVPVTFKNVIVGQLLPIRVSQVMATGTTATNLLAII